MASKVTRDHHTWTRDTIKNVSGDVTLDLAGDLTIDVAGGQMTVTDNTAADPDLIIKSNDDSSSAGSLIFSKDRDGAGGRPGQDGDSLGFINWNGYDDAPGAHTFAQIKGNILDARNGQEKGSMTLKVLTSGSLISGTDTGLLLEGTATNDEVDVTIANGVASRTTIAGDLDIDGDTITSAGALEIDAGGDVSITGQDVNIDTTKKLYLDGGSHTYIQESGDDILDIYVGALNMMKFTESLIDKIEILASQLEIDAGYKFYLDGGSDTYIHEVSADRLEIVVGGDEMLTLNEANSRVTIEADKISYSVSGGGGTEWGAEDSAYAGHILAYTCIGANAADDGQVLTTSFLPVIDSGATEIAARFKTPPSEFVEIEVELYFSSGSGASDLFLSLSDTTVYGGNGLTNPAQFEKRVCTPARGNGGTVVQKFILGADNLVTVGQLNTIYLHTKTDSTTGTPIINWGGDAVGDYTNLVMKATALPASIVVGT